MSKVLLYPIFGVIFCLIGYSLFSELMAQSENVPAPIHPIVALPSVASSIISENERASLKASADRGNCNAALRLGKYNLDVTLQNDEAIKWLRIAGKCPDIRAKAWLVAALLTKNEDPAVDAEIDSVVLEMKKIDPESVKTTSIGNEVQRRRRPQSKTE
jgi:hypothetical protein